MAIAVELHYSGAGATLANYDELLSCLGVSSGGTHPGSPDCLFHWAAKTSNGFRVVDVWKNQAALDEFINHTINPASAALGLPGPSQPPTITYLHSFLT